MNERDVALIRAVTEECRQVMEEMQESFSKALADKGAAHQQQLDKLSEEIATLKQALQPELPDIGAMVSEAVAALPPAKDGKDFDPAELQKAVEEAVSQSMAEAVKGIPVPVVPDVAGLVDAKFAALPPAKDGKDYDPEALQLAVEKAVAEVKGGIPIPRNGEDGKDALALEILPCIDTEKNYPRNTYATHNGGLWRTYEQSHGMRGWECIVDGVAGVSVEQSDKRCITVTTKRASGKEEAKSFDVPVILYQGVFKTGQTYSPGDTVTWGGSLWHCDTETQDKPGEPGSSGWTLAAKRGRDGRDKA